MQCVEKKCDLFLTLLMLKTSNKFYTCLLEIIGYQYLFSHICIKHK